MLRLSGLRILRPAIEWHYAAKLETVNHEVLPLAYQNLESSGQEPQMGCSYLVLQDERKAIT